MQHKPYRPFVTIEHFYNYPAVSTGSSICDAVADALFNTRLLRVAEIAEYLEIDPRKLSNAMQIESGLTLQQIVQSYRLHQVQQYMIAHPDQSLELQAHAAGFSSDSVLSDLIRRECHGTAEELLSYLLPMLAEGKTENEYLQQRPDGVYVFRSAKHRRRY